MPTPTTPLGDAELAASAGQVAGAIQVHPLALQFGSTAITALSAIATGEFTATAAERRLLRQALAAIDAAEVEISRGQP